MVLLCIYGLFLFVFKKYQHQSSLTNNTNARKEYMQILGCQIADDIAGSSTSSLNARA
jgi:hypothetical protein